jgi:HAD superfamily phosphoserine phosphatase-like hydrolase
MRFSADNQNNRKEGELFMVREQDPIDQVLELMAVPDKHDVYVLGCFGRHITIYSQQVRALNLAYALHKTNRIGAGTQIAVIGGGAAGLTLTVAAARLGAAVTLLEKLYAPMGIQRGSTKRYVHPHVYDWPDLELEGADAQLPVLTWTADYADKVVCHIEGEWDRELQRSDRILAHWDVQDVDIAQTTHDSRITVTWNDSKRGPHGGEFDLVILAVGFGCESDVGTGYWEDEGLDKIGARRKICLVSGCGDGGLTDLMRLCIKEFRHDRIVGMFAGHPHSREIGIRLLEAEEQFRESGDIRKLSKYYQDLDVKHVQTKLRTRLRSDTRVYLTARSWWDVYSPKSSILNRFIVSQLARLNAWNWITGPTQGPATRTAGSKYVIHFGEDGKKEKQYDIVVQRHGPKPSLDEGFPSIRSSCRDLAERWQRLPPYLDVTRKRLPWEGVFDVPDTSEDGGPARMDEYRLVAFDLDGTLLQGDNYKWSWTLVWKHLNYADTVRSNLMTRYLNKKKDGHAGWYKEWCDRTAALFRKKGLKRADFAAITNGLTPVDGLDETISALKSRGLKLAIISGGIDVFLLEKMSNYAEFFDYVFINKFSFDKDGLFTGVAATPYDFEGKWKAIQEICEWEGLTANQVVFVGDGFNDEDVIGRVGLTIGFKPGSSLMQSNVNIVIKEPDLRNILPHVLKVSERQPTDATPA